MRPSEVFAARLREIRALRGVSQVEAARRMTNSGRPMDKTAVLRIENGQRGFSLDEAFALAVVTNAAPSLLFTPAEDETMALTDRVAVRGDAFREWFSLGMLGWVPEPETDEHRQAKLAGAREQAVVQLAQRIVDAWNARDRSGIREAARKLVEVAAEDEGRQT